MRVVLDTLQGGGSGRGVSYWKRWMGCERQALFYETAGRFKGKVSKALVIGTIVHAMLELYYKLAMLKGPAKPLALKTTAIRFVDDAGDPADIADEARIEADRLFRAYRVQFPPTELGRVVGVEEQVEGSRVEHAVGVSPYTAKPDLIVQLTKVDCKRLWKTRRIKVWPGYWLVDHKTEGEPSAEQLLAGWAPDEAFADSIQFTAYMLAYQAKYPRRAVEGLLVNVIPKSKRPEFRTLVVPWPSMKKIAVLRTFLDHASSRQHRALRLGHAPANITYCFAYNQPCPFRGRCDQGAT